MPPTRCTLTTQRISHAIAPGHRSPVRFLRSIPPRHTAFRSFADPILQIGHEPSSTPPCGTGPMPPPMTGHSGRSLWQGYVTRCTSRFPDRSLRPWHCARKAWPRRRATTVQHSPVSAPRFWPQPCWQPCGAHQRIAPLPPSAADFRMSTNMEEVNAANLRMPINMELPPATDLRMPINMEHPSAANLGMSINMEPSPATDFGMSINMEEVNAARFPM